MEKRRKFNAHTVAFFSDPDKDGVVLELWNIYGGGVVFTRREALRLARAIIKECGSQSVSGKEVE